MSYEEEIVNAIRSHPGFRERKAPFAQTPLEDDYIAEQSAKHGTVAAFLKVTFDDLLDLDRKQFANSVSQSVLGHSQVHNIDTEIVWAKHQIMVLFVDITL